MMNMKYIAGICLAALALSACDDTTDEIGTSLINNLDHLEISADTFKVETSSFIAESVLMRNATNYLGRIRDPETNTYITANFMSQFHTIDDLDMPAIENMVNKKDGKVVADSCEIRLFYTDFYGDTLTTMKLTAYELEKPLPESVKYYSDFDIEKSGYIREDGIRVNKSYTLTDMNTTNRSSTYYTPNVRILLNDEYTDLDGNTYDNYGTYILRAIYEHPEYFKNSYNFVNNVVPGFYFKMQSGLGAMAYIHVSQLNVYFTYLDNGEEVRGTASFAGTEEVLNLTHIINDRPAIEKLASDNTCTYLKTPAGIFTEITLPVEEIVQSHENDTINTAKITLTRINNTTTSDYALEVPQTLLLIPRDSLYSFFEHKNVANYKTSYLATYNSTYNNYTFNNIGSLVKEMSRTKELGEATENWNKVIVVPVTASYSTASYTTASELTKVVHDMSLASTKLVGGSSNPNGDITISVIYSKFK